MPITKRTTKIVSYNEQDDDEDFIPIGNNTKKSRDNKSTGPSKEVKVTTKQPSRKNDEKICQPQEIEEEEEPVLFLQRLEEPIIIENQNKTNNQSTVSSNETLPQSPPELDDPEESSSPKIKRMKHEKDDENENESPEEKSDFIIKNNELPVMSSIDLNTSRTRSSGPLGFPISKINIPSPHNSRVGLSRKSSTIKPLHPNFTSRVVHD